MLIAAASVFVTAVAAVSAAPPASLPDGPDLAVMALSASDFAGANVSTERYVAETGAIAAYEREFTLRGRLIFAANQVLLYDSATAAHADLVLLRRVLATARGRSAYAKAFRGELAVAAGRQLRIKKLIVSRPASLRAGDYAFRFSLTLVSNIGRLHVAISLIRTERAVGLIGLIASPGRTVPASEIARVTQAQATRFRTGLTITSLAAPLLSGPPVQGQSLSADRGRWTGGPTGYTHQWSRCDTAGANCAAIPGATTAAYTLTPADAGHTVRVRVEARNGISSLAVDSMPTVVIS